jgi:hypothetical protein
MRHKNQKMTERPTYGYVDNFQASYPHDPQAQQQHKGFTYEFLGANS